MSEVRLARVANYPCINRVKGHVQLYLTLPLSSSSFQEASFTHIESRIYIGVSFLLCLLLQMKVSDIIKNLKGYSSYKLRSKYPIYRKKFKALWSPSYYCESVGRIYE